MCTALTHSHAHTHTHMHTHTRTHTHAHTHTHTHVHAHTRTHMHTHTPSHPHPPDIHSIFPLSGSDQGGTLLTIQGTGFGINTDDISVDVDGIPCQIVSHSASKIQCWTGRPPAGSPAVASDNNRYPITDRGYRFRGVSVFSVVVYC